MAESSQSAMRIIALIFFTMLFAGAWANDRPRETMAQKELPKPTAILSQEETPGEEILAPLPTEELVEEVVATDVPQSILEELKPVSLVKTMTISIETEGLTLHDESVQSHLQRLPLGIANGDYMMINSQGGMGWIRIRGQQRDAGERLLTTTVNDVTVNYLRVTPFYAALPEKKVVPVPAQYAGDELTTVR